MDFPKRRKHNGDDAVRASSSREIGGHIEDDEEEDKREFEDIVFEDNGRRIFNNKDVGETVGLETFLAFPAFLLDTTLRRESMCPPQTALDRGEKVAR